MFPYQCNGPDGDPGGDDPAADHSQPGTQGVSQDSAHTHAVHVLSGSLTGKIWNYFFSLSWSPHFTLYH